MKLTNVKLVVGLGNPGRRYATTRHNIGFMAVDRMVSEWELRPSWQAAIAKQGDIIYLKPLTYMNLSGSAVAAVRMYFKIDVSQILVIYDDKDIPFGTIRFRERGSAGGHKGMLSIIAQLKTEEIARLKVGIAPATQTVTDTADFVLERFTPTERQQLPDILEQTRKKLTTWLKKIPTDPNV